MESCRPILILNIKGLVLASEHISVPVKGRNMQSLPVMLNSWLFLSNGFIEDYGAMSILPDEISSVKDIIKINAEGKYVFPSFCDSHSHIVFAGSREQEFVERIQGRSYEDIARMGGGILNSVAKLRQTSEEELFLTALVRVNEVIRTGTGALEIKSGYGLSLEDEMKMLRVIKKLKAECPLQIKATFLGAHAIPKEYISKPNDYVELVINEMIPAIAAENLADYIDVFCDIGFFNTEQTERILTAGIKFGLKPKLHANQLNNSGAVQLGIKHKALSVDHMENMGVKEIQSLLGSETVPVLLPGAAFFLRSALPPARQMIDAGLPVALASDYNPGSAPSGNMKMILSLACILLRMLPAEAIYAATINGACAMGLEDEMGTLSKGKIANLFITKEMPSLDFFPYAFGSELIDMIILNGIIIGNNKF